MAQAIVATITDTARSKIAEMLSEGRAFTVTDFVTGEGGHDPGDPSVALTPDPTVMELPEQTFGPKALSSKEQISPFCVEYIAELEDAEAVGTLSNIGLIATITFSPTPADPLIGTTFLFALANFPRQEKVDTEEKVYQIQVQY